MSTALFLNTDKPIPKSWLKKKKIRFEEITEEIIMQPIKQENTLQGYYYFFDSMWLPFSVPVVFYKNRKRFYMGAKRYVKWITHTVKKLQKNQYCVNLFLYSVGKPMQEFGERKGFTLLNLDEATVFEQGVIYEIK